MTINNEALRAARLAMGWSIARLARECGTSSVTIDKLEKGHTRSSKYFPKLAAALGVPFHLLDPAYAISDQAGPASPLKYEVMPIKSDLGPATLPIYSSTEAGDGHAVSMEPVRIVPRPWFLHEVKDGFGIVVAGYSMYPAFAPGDVAIVNPRLPIGRGRDVLMVRDETPGNFFSILKHLRDWTADEWLLTQHTAPETEQQDFALKRSDWPKALCVVGKCYA